MAALPTVSDPDFHALDFAMWCAAGITLLKTDELRPLAAPEVNTYPAIFAKVLGATGAGFEAILRILTRFPELASDPMGELIKADQVRDANLAAVVELYDAVFHLVAEMTAATSSCPSRAPNCFSGTTSKGSPRRKSRPFSRCATSTETVPIQAGRSTCSGWLYRDPGLAADVVGRIAFWIESGLFDRIDASMRSEMPCRFFGFVAGLIEDGAAEEDVRRLLNAAAHRIRKHFRAATTESVLLRNAMDRGRGPAAGSAPCLC